MRYSARIVGVNKRNKQRAVCFAGCPTMATTHLRFVTPDAMSAGNGGHNDELHFAIATPGIRYREAAHGRNHVACLQADTGEFRERGPLDEHDVGARAPVGPAWVWGLLRVERL